MLEGTPGAIESPRARGEANRPHRIHTMRLPTYRRVSPYAPAFAGMHLAAFGPLESERDAPPSCPFPR